MEIPSGKMLTTSYLGFYGRVTDSDGNPLEGIIYSINGGNEEELQIMTQGLSSSTFQFQAVGGNPGYTWEITDGSLPDNLQLNADGTIADGLVNGKADPVDTIIKITTDSAERRYQLTDLYL